MQKVVPSSCFINPEPLTKRGIRENNRQIHLIYTDKHGNQLHYVVVAAKVGGSAFGTLFAKVSSSKRWIGKIGDSRDLIEQARYTFADINLDVIFEKLAYDLYEEFGRGFFRLPKSRLSEELLINQFGPTKPRWDPVGGYGRDCLFDFIQQNSDKSSIRIMAKYVEGYQDLKDGKTNEDGTELSCYNFIKKHRRPPETLVTPDGHAVPLHGLMELIAVGRVLADTDTLGGSCDNAGFVWVREEDGKIVAAQVVKIDPGKGLNFSATKGSIPKEDNWVLNTKYDLAPSRKLDDLKDIQTAQNHKPVFLLWSALTQRQRDIFLGILFNSSRYLQAQSILHYLFYRDGKFQHLPEAIAQQFQADMKEWMELQLEIYGEDLKVFHQTHPNIALKSHYIDTCGFLTIPMSKEKFPIRELFTELVIIKDTNPKVGTSEKDSFKETTDNLNLLANTIPLQNLFKTHRTVLLIGRAGIGKSTLCQKIAHDWASGRLWNDTFDTVYWLTLRHLNGMQLPQNPYDFLALLAVPHFFHNLPSAKTLSTHITDPSQKILLILDGYDEASELLVLMIHKLLTETPFHILITSRPGKFRDLPVNQIVENIGFSDTHIQTYIEKFSQRHDPNTQTKGQVLYNALKESPYLYPVSHIPLQLQMIVSLFEKEGHILQATSLTQLYDLITHALYDWNLPKDPHKTQNLLTLGQIALIGLAQGKLIISNDTIQHPFSPALLKTGILKKTRGNKNDYYFLHLTFQEYLIALYVSLQTPKKQAAFILENRHKPTYQLVFAFFAGLIHKDREKLEHFFASLHQESSILALSPTYQLELTLRCLNECEGLKDKIPAIDTFVNKHPNLLTQPLSDGKVPLLSLASQRQTVASQWLISHYYDLLQKKEETPPQSPPPVSTSPTTTTTTITAGALLDSILGLLDKETVQQDPIYALLEQKSNTLFDADPQAALTPEDVKFYNCIGRLLDPSGKVRSAVSKQLQQPVGFPGTSPVTPSAVPQVTPTATTTTTQLVIPDCAFGKAKWEMYFGDVGVEPPLPADIHQILQGPCPIWEGKKVEETHVLVLIPAAVDGKPLTLELLGELIQKPKAGSATKYECFFSGEYPDNPVNQSYWVLMTKDVLEGSRDKSWKDQLEQVAVLARRTKVPYAPPKVLEAATCVLMHHVSTGQKLYVDSPWTLTRCEEFYNKEKGWKLAVGGFSSSGLIVDSSYDGCGDDVGVGGARKFL